MASLNPPALAVTLPTLNLARLSSACAPPHDIRKTKEMQRVSFPNHSLAVCLSPNALLLKPCSLSILPTLVPTWHPQCLRCDEGSVRGMPRRRPVHAQSAAMHANARKIQHSSAHKEELAEADLAPRKDHLSFLAPLLAFAPCRLRLLLACARRESLFPRSATQGEIGSSRGQRWRQTEVRGVGGGRVLCQFAFVQQEGGRRDEAGGGRKWDGSLGGSLLAPALALVLGNLRVEEIIHLKHACLPRPSF